MSTVAPVVGLHAAFAAPLLSPLRYHHQSSRASPRRPRTTRPATCSAAAARPGSSSFNQDAASASDNVNSPPPPNVDGPVWESLSGCDVLTIPSATPPVAVVRFTGGLGAGAAPRALYGTFLEEIARRGNVAIVAAPLGASFDHIAQASAAAAKLGAATQELVARWDVPWVPAFGMGHSLGAKMQLLAGCDAVARAAQGPVVANLLLAFNNFSARESIPMWDAVRTALEDRGTERSARELGKVADFLRDLDVSALTGDNAPAEAVDKASQVLKKVGNSIAAFSTGMAGGDYSPNPEETLGLVGGKYSVPENLLISFSRDTLDQSEALAKVLRARFGARRTVVRKLEGSHVTPLTPSFGRDASNFASVGSGILDEEIRKAAGGVTTELNATVAVVVAFLRLHLEVLAEKKMVP